MYGVFYRPEANPCREERLMVINENADRKVIPIASGKGGVGKTVLAANMALALAINGKSVVLVDLDLGGSNLHTVLGMKNTNLGIGNFLSTQAVKFKDIVIPTPFQNLRFIPGDVLVSGASNIQFSQKKKLMQSILELEADYVIIDLGSGGSCHVIDFFLVSNSGFVVVTPQATSIVNGYGLLKNTVFRFLQRAFASHQSINSYIKKLLKEKKPNASPPVSEMLAKMLKLDRQAGERAKRYIEALKPKFVINMARSPEDLQIVEQLRDLVRRNLNLDVECMGLIFRDDAVDRAIEEGSPLSTSQGDTVAGREIFRISQKILQSEAFPNMPLELDYYADTYELTLLEAQNDFEDLQADGGEDDDVGAADLLAIVSEQKRQIDELRGTVRMLTLRGR
jgi:flagellar biosynthesis protein FlhG